MSDLGAFPTNPSFRTVSFKLNTPTQSSETFSGKVRRVGFGVSYYTFTVQYPNLPAREAGIVQGFAARAFGPQLSFDIVLPKVSYSNFTDQTTSLPYTVGATARGAKEVSLTNCGASKNVLAAGDFFKFAGQDKVYMCVADCLSNSSGNATLYFSGSLIESVANNIPLTITAVPFTMILESDQQEWDVGVGGITSIELPMREVW
jgi:hypothetical protein